MGVPGTVANGVCVRELGRANRKEKVLERISKYWLRLWEADESNPIGDALKYQLEGRGNNWLGSTQKELEQWVWKHMEWDRKMMEMYGE
jgi:hypothetical protein